MRWAVCIRLVNVNKCLDTNNLHHVMYLLGIAKVILHNLFFY